MMQDTPFGRMENAKKVADGVVFLASPLVSYIHGANIRVNGVYVATAN